MAEDASIPNTLEAEEEEAQVPSQAVQQDPGQKEGRKGERERKEEKKCKKKNISYANNFKIHPNI